MPCREIVELGGVEAAEAVAAGQDQQGSVAVVDVVEMDPERGHAGGDAVRRFDVRDAGFHRPRTEACNVFARADGDGAVLAKGERPVGVGALVEQDRAHRAGAGTDMVGCDPADGAGRG